LFHEGVDAIILCGGKMKNFTLKVFTSFFIFLHINLAIKTLKLVMALRATLLNFCEKKIFLGDMIKKEKLDIKRQVFIFSNSCIKNSVIKY